MFVDIVIPSSVGFDNANSSDLQNSTRLLHKVFWISSDLIPTPQPHDEILVKGRCAEFVKSLQNSRAMVCAVVDQM